MSIETYEQALDFWSTRTNYELVGMPTDPSALRLDRMRAVLERLGHPEEELRIIHVAGSKGKGSTAAMLSAVLRQAGYRTGLFTSPHLSKAEERVQVDGQPITPAEFCQRMREIEPAVRAVEAQETSPLTYFEIITALGFLHFARSQVEVAIIEVGLGGRLDSTNVCTPLVSVITSISFDHMAQLGNTLAAIAGEKAGIIKPCRPAISGVKDPEAAGAIALIAREQGAPLQVLGRDFSYRYRAGRIMANGWEYPRVTVRTSAEQWPEMALSLIGKHQAANAAVAVACIEELRRQGVRVPIQAVRHGLAKVVWPARIEVMSSSPFVVLDCSHNVSSIQALVDTLRVMFAPARRGLVFACSHDKDLPGMLALLVPHFEKVCFTRYTSSPRGAPAEELSAVWRRVGGGACEVFGKPAEALAAARKWATGDDLICVSGSVFLAGELRPLLLDP